MKMKQVLFTVVSMLLLFSCGNEKPKVTEDKDEVVKAKAPEFNADSAFYFIEKQVSFGPRVPETAAHNSCILWLEQKFKEYSVDVFIQEGPKTNQTKYRIRNLIVSFNKEAKDRILLCAHWDSRAMADQDKERKAEPILGADDGASGVGVLLEVARVLSSQPLKSTGVDIILFDVEDQGISGPAYEKDSWCVGAQYWSKNPHIPNYRARFGVLLDMVGAKAAHFPKEGVSLKHASYYVDKIWSTAWEIGYSDYFENKEERQIIDDHLYVNEIRQIPTVDIIYISDESPTGFGSHWHTHQDNLDIIGKNTLKAVGQTLIQVLYQEDLENQ